MMHPKYRQDIDGLRGIAIIAVVWYHAYPSALRSGFIGVDIFFVLSGFLISTIIFSSLEKDAFSTWEFYKRRINRILPALILVMLTSFIFGWFALTDEEYMQLGKHIAGGAAFISNLLLWQESGYFDAAAETKPMLHLWSLAIEEQFYIFWPIVLMVTWRKGYSFLKITAVTALASLAISLYQTGTDATAAFYSPLARCWELMAGSMLAYIVLHRPDLNNRYKELQSVGGLLLLVIGLIVIDRWKSFPGAWALLPVAGTVLLLSAGPHAWLNRKLLSFKPLVWVGLISYPLYLWHWPLLSYVKILKSQQPSIITVLVLVVASFLLAWLTYRFVERPCRFGRFKGAMPAILLSLLLLTGGAAWLDYQANGFQFRASAPKLHEVNRGDIGHQEFLKRMRAFAACRADQQPEDVTLLACLQTDAGRPATLAIVGDSHAQQLFFGLSGAIDQTNMLLFMQDGIPVAGDAKFDAIYRHIIQDKSVEQVIVTAYWAWRLRSGEQLDQFGGDLLRTVRLLLAAGKKVVVVAGDVPNFSFDPAKCKYSGRLGLGFGPVNQCREDNSRFMAEKNRFAALIGQALVAEKRVQLVDLSRFFCDSAVWFYGQGWSASLSGQEPPEYQWCSLPWSTAGSGSGFCRGETAMRSQHIYDDLQA